MTIGTGFGWAIVKALEGEGLTTFVIPFGQLAVITLIAAAAGVAAVLPVRRAARLDVLGAITSE